MMLDAMLRAMGFDPADFKSKAENTAREVHSIIEEFRAHNFRMEKKMDLLLEVAYDKNELQEKLKAIFSTPLTPQ